MITPSVSWFVKNQKDADIVKEFTIDLGINVQLAFYERRDADNWMFKLAECSSCVSSIHLPKGLNISDYHKDGIVGELVSIYGTKRFVVHPWSRDLPYIVDMVRDNKWLLNLECFSRKGAGNPFLLLAQYGEEFLEDHVGLCVDFSHLESELANPTFVKGLLPYTKMLHVSNRLGKQQHLPVFVQTADTNAHQILAQVLEVPKFPVQDIVLEYMPDYHDRLGKQYYWLDSYIQQKRRKLNGTV
jgi:hypothetical protein